MSDFDEEAERERLREKYEREQEKRESTERMSELLLKGATMTNAHCNNCGDPIFRYDGEEFCPTCQEVVASADEAAAESGEGATADTGESGAEADVETGVADSDADGGDTRAESGGDTDTTAARTPGGIETRQPVESADTDANGAETDSAPETGETSTQQEVDRTARPLEPTEASQTPPEPAGDAADLEAARESLTRTLLAQARRAEECDDPRRARDHIAAAREAAEALSALSY